MSYRPFPPIFTNQLTASSFPRPFIGRSPLPPPLLLSRMVESIPNRRSRWRSHSFSVKIINLILSPSSSLHINSESRSRYTRTTEDIFIWFPGKEGERVAGGILSPLDGRKIPVLLLFPRRNFSPSPHPLLLAPSLPSARGGFLLE